MSILCEVTQITKVEKHPDADSLDIVYFGEFKTISRLGQFKVGDYGIYLATACVLPELLLRRINMWDEKNNCGLLGGNKGDRIKPKKLRGIVSEGIMYGPHSLEYLQELTGLEDPVGADVQKHLEVEKYNPNIFDAKTGRKLGGGDPIYCFQARMRDTHKYDIENIKKHANQLEQYFTSTGEDCCISEKIHGCVSGDVLVDTFEMGAVPISEIVNENLDVHVASFNHQSNEIEYSKVTGRQRLPNNYDWYKITTFDGQEVILTGEHPVYVVELLAYRRVDELTEGLTVMLNV